MIRPSPLLAICLAAGFATRGEAQEWDCSKADNLPQQGMNFCAAEEYQQADRALNILWPTVVDFMKRQDTDLKDIDPALVGARPALLKAQRAWIDYRDGQCELEGFYARGGTLEPLLVANCKTKLTRRRTEELLLLMETN